MRPADPKKLPRILEASATLFAERPFHEVRVEDIAARAHVAKGTIYLFFKDKEQLFQAMIVEAIVRQLAETREQIAGERDPLRKLRVVIEASVRFSDRYPHYLELLNDLDSNRSRAGDPSIAERRADYHGLIEGILRELDAEGRATIANPERAALALQGMQRRILLETPRPWPDDLATWIKHQFLYGVSGSPR